LLDAESRKPTADSLLKMKKIYYILTFLLCVHVQTANAQMGVNSTGALPATSAMLDVSSTTKGFLMPRLTTTQRSAITSPATGLMIFNTTINEMEIYQSGVWRTASRLNVPLLMTGSTAIGSTAIIEAFNFGTGDGIKVSANTAIRGLGTSTGIYGEATAGTGTFGKSDSYRGVWGRGVTTGDGVVGDAVSGKGVKGITTGSGIGVYGEATAGSGDAVIGDANSGTGGYFRSASGTGVAAISSSSYGLVAENTSATVPVVQVGNLSGGTGIEVIASTALKVTGAIKVTGGITAQPAFKITTNTAGGGNTTGNVLTIPNTTLANNANDILLVTHNYSPNNTYLNKAHGVFWSALSNTWNIYLEDLSAMPNNITFNVLVIKQ
jgi:trimeric autotransporter adhesin